MLTPSGTPGAVLGARRGSPEGGSGSFPAHPSRAAEPASGRSGRFAIRKSTVHRRNHSTFDDALRGGVEGGEAPRGGTPLWLANRRLRFEAARLWPARKNRAGVVVPSGLMVCRAFSPHRNREADPVPMEAVRSDDSAHVLGTNTCKDRGCAECASRRAVEEQRELACVLNVARDERGMTVIFSTMTIAHGFGDSFGTVRDGMDASWDGTFSGRWWKDFREAYGVVGMVRRFESTYGENGHHPHYHVLWFLSRPVEDVYAFDSAILDRFADQVRKHMGEHHVPYGAHAIVSEVCERGDGAARYLSKMASELASATTKTHGNPSMPFGVLRRVREVRESESDGKPSHERMRLEAALHNWREGSKGTVIMSWSKSLGPLRAEARARLEAEPEEREPEEHAAFLPPAYAPRFLRHARASERFLSAVANGSGAGVLRRLWRDAECWRDEDERARAVDAWDREQRRWVRGDAGAWVLRSADPSVSFAWVFDASGGTCAARREEVCDGN